MEIQTLTENVIYTKQGTRHIIDFGEIPLNYDATVKVRAIGNRIKNFVSKPHCSCTLTAPKKIDDNTIELSLTYKNTNQQSPFEKTVTVNFIENGTKKREEIKLKGIVR